MMDGQTFMMNMFYQKIVKMLKLENQSQLIQRYRICYFCHLFVACYKYLIRALEYVQFIIDLCLAIFTFR